MRANVAMTFFVEPFLHCDT